jgi:hypothetical protein
MIQKDFDLRNFDDSFLLEMDFSNWQEEICLSFFCSAAKRFAKKNRYFKIRFKRVLFFGFEAAALGEFGKEPMFIDGIIQLKDSAELKAWKKRLKDLAKPGPSYPKGMRSLKYKEVYHFLIDSMELQPLAFFTGLRGFQIICRDFEISRIPNPKPDSQYDLDPMQIPAG